MVESIKIVTLRASSEKVFKVITDNEKYKWRTDLEKVEIIDEMHFKEYAKGGYITEFSITNVIPNERYEFDLKNNTMKGHFIAELKEINSNETELKLVEQIEANSVIMKLIVKTYLKKQQESYVKDLQTELNR